MSRVKQFIVSVSINCIRLVQSIDYNLLTNDDIQLHKVGLMQIIPVHKYMYVYMYIYIYMYTEHVISKTFVYQVAGQKRKHSSTETGDGSHPSNPY